MKWLLLIVFALVMIVAIAIGGGLGLFMNQSVDMNDPQVAQKFQQMMSSVCLQRAKSEVAAAGQTLDYQQEALVKQVCECHMKEVTKIIAKKGAKTPVEAQKAINESEQEANAAFESCAAAYGLQ